MNSNSISGIKKINEGTYNAVLLEVVKKKKSNNKRARWFFKTEDGAKVCGNSGGKFSWPTHFWAKVFFEQDIAFKTLSLLDLDFRVSTRPTDFFSFLSRACGMPCKIVVKDRWLSDFEVVSEVVGVKAPDTEYSEKLKVVKR